MDCSEANVRAESSRLYPTNRQLGKADSAPPTPSELAWGPLNHEMAKGERGGDLELRFREPQGHPSGDPIAIELFINFARKTILTGVNNKFSIGHSCHMQMINENAGTFKVKE